jgi:hypothetical protein
VAELVKDDGGEEEKRCDRPHQPVGALAQVRIGLRKEPHRQRDQHEHGHDQPADVDPDVESEQPEQLESFPEHGFGS